MSSLFGSLWKYTGTYGSLISYTYSVGSSPIKLHFAGNIIFWDFFSILTREGWSGNFRVTYQLEELAYIRKNKIVIETRRRGRLRHWHIYDLSFSFVPQPNVSQLQKLIKHFSNSGLLFEWSVYVHECVRYTHTKYNLLNNTETGCAFIVGAQATEQWNRSINSTLIWRFPYRTR